MSRGKLVDFDHVKTKHIGNSVGIAHGFYFCGIVKERFRCSVAGAYIYCESGRYELRSERITFFVGYRVENPDESQADRKASDTLRRI